MEKTFKSGDIVSIKDRHMGGEVVGPVTADGLVPVKIAHMHVGDGGVATEVWTELFRPEELEVINKKSGVVVL